MLELLLGPITIFALFLVAMLYLIFLMTIVFDTAPVDEEEVQTIDNVALIQKLRRNNRGGL